jgi:hypothetical protein
LGFAPGANGVHNSKTLVIKFAHHKGALTTNFATNLGGGAVTVLNKANHSWKMTGSAWSNIGLTNTFDYDPAKGDLLVDITVTGNSTTGSSNAACKTGARQRLYAFSWTTPPATGNISATAALKMRVCTGTKPPTIPGKFATYGAGCGAKPSCLSYNMGAKTTSAGGNANRFATGSFVASAGQSIIGATVRTKAKTAAGGTVTVQVAMTDAAGKPTAVNMAKCTIKVTSTTFGSFSGKFAKPIPLKGGQRFTIIHAGDGQVDHPRNADANAVKVPHYWRSPTGSTWSGPWTSVTWAVQADCSGGASATPAISATGTPKVNASFAVNLGKAANSAPCALIIGAARTNINLAGLGAPGCSVLVASMVTLPGKASSTGAASTKLKVPNNPYFGGKKLNFQWAVIDAKANLLGLAMTSGGEATIGN